MKDGENSEAVDTLVARSINSDVPPEVRQRLRRRLAAFRHRMDAAAAERRPGWSIPLIHRWPATLRYAAPVVALSLAVAVIWMVAGGGNGSRAYARVIDQIRQAGTLVYHMTVLAPAGMPALEADVMYKEPGLYRRESTSGSRAVAVVDAAQRKGIAFNEDKKTYLTLDVTNMPGAEGFDLVEEMRSLPTRATEGLGEREMNGRTVHGFLVIEEGFEKRVWIDAESGDLVRIEGRFLNAPEADVIMSDFRFDVELDDSLFRIEPPAGYREIAALSVGAPTEDDLVSFLRWWAEHHKRRLFPPTLEPAAFLAAMKELYEAGELVEPAPGQESEAEILAAALTMTQGLQFLKEMKPENDWHYAGEGVALGDANTAIAWWRPAGAETYRVIYGDLTILDVPANQLPAAPAEASRFEPASDAPNAAATTK